MCCKANRHVAMYVHQSGHDTSGPVIMQVHKSFGAAACCVARPAAQIFDGQANKIGSVDDPWKCCVMDQRIYDVNGDKIFGTAGSVCQPGMCCPCLGNVEFNVTGPNGEPTNAHISKVFNGCSEMMAKVNNF